MTTTASSNISRKLTGASALLALAVLFIGFVILMTFLLRGARLDLTESGLYSIAPGTERILKNLKEPVNLYFFFSEETSATETQLRNYAQRVRELLEEMAQRSKGKVRLTVIDPKPFTEEEDQAAEYGLQGVPINARNDSVYLGLAGTNSTDGREVISFFQPNKEEFLEYDIASLIYKLDTPKRPKLGLISSLQVDASFDQMSGRMLEGYASVRQIRELFEVQTLTVDVTSIPNDIDMLMLIHPRELSPSTLYAIDQFVMRGGKLMAFLDPQAENDPAAAHGGNPGASRASSLGPLLDAWGIQFNAGEVVADRNLGLTLKMRQDLPASQNLAILGFNRDAMTKGDVVTSALDNINAMTVGSFKVKEGASVKLEPLLQSSTNAALIPTARVAVLTDAESLQEGFAPTGQRYIVAGRLRGKLRTAFPNGPPGAATLAAPAPTAEPLKETKDEANIILIGDTDLLADQTWVQTQNVFGQRFAQAFANNGDFFANAVDNLAGSADLISIRGRQSFFRPFDKVAALRKSADERLRATQKDLESTLKETEGKLAQLQSQRANQSSLVLTPEQEAEVARFQQERANTRKELRNVQRSLDVEIERLGSILKIVNIALIPILIAVAAVLLSVSRRRKLAAGRAAAHTG
jgi:ABC-type uncharacterized transport system involved in gliding motility auxiliary subunit